MCTVYMDNTTGIIDSTVSTISTLSKYYTYKELRQMASDKGIPGPTTKNKAQLCELLGIPYVVEERYESSKFARSHPRKVLKNFWCSSCHHEMQTEQRYKLDNEHRR